MPEQYGVQCINLCMLSYTASLSLPLTHTNIETQRRGERERERERVYLRAHPHAWVRGNGEKAVGREHVQSSICARTRTHCVRVGVSDSRGLVCVGVCVCKRERERERDRHYISVSHVGCLGSYTQTPEFL
jgi:hypothetical protein